MEGSLWRSEVRLESRKTSCRQGQGARRKRKAGACRGVRRRPRGRLWRATHSEGPQGGEGRDHVSEGAFQAEDCITCICVHA